MARIELTFVNEKNGICFTVRRELIDGDSFSISTHPEVVLNLRMGVDKMEMMSVDSTESKEAVIGSKMHDR